MSKETKYELENIFFACESDINIITHMGHSYCPDIIVRMLKNQAKLAKYLLELVKAQVDAGVPLDDRRLAGPAE